MTKQNQRTGVLVAVLIVCAISARVLGKFDVFPVPLGLVRTILYISLYIGWGLSVSHRILQTQVRRYMVGVSCLTVFWFVIRSIKYFFVVAPDAIRHLWYWYYCPMLFIPLLSVFVSIVSAILAANGCYKNVYVPNLLFKLEILQNFEAWKARL